MAAEHAGGARWCLETATDYAKIRVQFGRPIGQFQAVKHRLADMAIRVEQMTAVAWDAAMAISAGASDDAGLAAATAAVPRPRGYALGAKECLQLLGGIGFTWEHDVHLHLKRAMADRQLMGEPDAYCEEVATSARGGARRALAADLPADADRVRAQLAPVVAELAALEGPARRRAMVDAGLVMPTGPSRGAGMPAPSSRWWSTSSWPRRGSTDPTSASGPGPCPRSSPGAPPCSTSAGSTPP